MFVSFEGIDGSGKSTQIKLLAARLEEMQREVRVFREPGGSVLSEKIRALLLDDAFEVDPFAEMLLFSAARAQLVAKEIRPRIDAGTIVICDRFFDSTIAYQGYGREFGDVDWLADFQMRVTAGLAPVRTYLLRISAAAAVSRRRTRAGDGKEDRMEQGGMTFFERVEAAYDKLAAEAPSRIVVLDGHQSIEVLHQQIWADFKSL
ncbi:MAG: dTMP kinase [Bacteroidota bacterium]